MESKGLLLSVTGTLMSAMLLLSASFVDVNARTQTKKSEPTTLTSGTTEKVKPTKKVAKKKCTKKCCKKAKKAKKRTPAKKTKKEPTIKKVKKEKPVKRADKKKVAVKP